MFLLNALVFQLNEKLSSDLTKAKQRLQVTLNQLHELEAQKLIQTNQIAALETERLQLIGEKEELRKTFDDGLHEKIRELGEKCCQHRYDSSVHYLTLVLHENELIFFVCVMSLIAVIHFIYQGNRRAILSKKIRLCK